MVQWRELMEVAAESGIEPELRDPNFLDTKRILNVDSRITVKAPSFLIILSRNRTPGSVTTQEVNSVAAP
jgi:hypothetical protein